MEDACRAYAGLDAEPDKPPARRCRHPSGGVVLRECARWLVQSKTCLDEAAAANRSRMRLAAGGDDRVACGPRALG